MSVEVAILSYLAQHPEAKDTPEGIAEWWMLGSGIRPTTTEIKAALENLRARGLVVAEPGGDGRICYRASAVKKRSVQTKSNRNDK